MVGARAQFLVHRGEEAQDDGQFLGGEPGARGLGRRREGPEVGARGASRVGRVVQVDHPAVGALADPAHMPGALQPYVQTWNFNIQRKLPFDTVAEVSYSGSHGVHLMGIQEWDQLAPEHLALGSQLNSLVPNPFFGQIILDLQKEPTVVDRMAWQSVGPLYLTEQVRMQRYSGLTIWPSHFFIPRHFTGHEYTGGGPVFAAQEWGSTLGKYDELHKRKVA